MPANSHTGDLAAAIETSDRKQRQLAACVVLLLGSLLVVVKASREVRDARRAERAEWACLVEVVEGERDDARDRARFLADPGGQVEDREQPE